MECHAAGRRNTAVSAHKPAADNQNLDIRKLKTKNTKIAALNNTSTGVCNSLKASQFVG